MKKYDVMQKALAALKDYPDDGKVFGLKKLLAQPIENQKENELYYLLGASDGKALNEEVSKMPHTLIGGATGTGKSVLLSNILLSLAVRYSPEQVQLLLLDPKTVEFQAYEGLPHLVGGQAWTAAKDIFTALEGTVDEMEYRFSLFVKAGTRNINEYNAYQTSIGGAILPKLVVIVDEFADLMMFERKRAENLLIRIAQKSRAAGISLILSSQRMGADAISGPLKSNFIARIACKTSTVYDSRKILDESGAEKLTERGEFLYRTAVMPSSKLGKSAFVSDGEVRAVVQLIKTEWDG